MFPLWVLKVLAALVAVPQKYFIDCFIAAQACGICLFYHPDRFIVRLSPEDHEEKIALLIVGKYR